MVEKVKKHWDLVLVGGIGLTLAIVGVLIMSGMAVSPGSVLAATSTATVTVTATVEPWINIGVSTTSVALTPSLVDSLGNTYVGSSTVIDVNVGTNNSTGWTVNIKGTNNGLYKSAAPTSTIASVTGTSTITAGNDGYGANATSVLAGTTVGSYYNYWATTTVGEIKTGGQTFATTSAPNALQNVVDMKVYATATSTKPSGSYSDDIILTATTNI